MNHDTEEMMEKLESRGAAGTQEAPFTSAPTQMQTDAEATSGDFLRVLVLSGTALKQFVVPYKPDDKVASVLRALQTQLGPADSAVLHDYELYVLLCLSLLRVCMLLRMRVLTDCHLDTWCLRRCGSRPTR